MENIVPIKDPRYPKLLKQIGKDMPEQLYYKGEWDGKIFENCLAVVGARRMTSYGKQITEKLVSEIAGRGITIVSGFMYGIDATAHKAALDIGGRTIAVMPCGINLVHPEYQVKLYDEILENKGLVISEYQGDFLPSNWTYPRRNRIIAGLSKAALIVEAGERSGSLITANFAKKYQRKVFVVPGPLTSSLSKGICRLIKEGADIVTSGNDITDYYNIRYPTDIPGKNGGEAVEVRPLLTSKVFRGRTSSKLEQKIIQELQKEPMEIDRLSRILGISISEMGTVISMMQIKGLIFDENGKYYIKGA